MVTFTQTPAPPPFAKMGSIPTETSSDQRPSQTSSPPLKQTLDFQPLLDELFSIIDEHANREEPEGGALTDRILEWDTDVMVIAKNLLNKPVDEIPAEQFIEIAQTQMEKFYNEVAIDDFTGTSYRSQDRLVISGFFITIDQIQVNIPLTWRSQELFDRYLAIFAPGVTVASKVHLLANQTFTWARKIELPPTEPIRTENPRADFSLGFQSNTLEEVLELYSIHAAIPCILLEEEQKILREELRQEKQKSADIRSLAREEAEAQFQKAKEKMEEHEKTIRSKYEKIEKDSKGENQILENQIKELQKKLEEEKKNRVENQSVITALQSALQEAQETQIRLQAEIEEQRRRAQEEYQRNARNHQKNSFCVIS